MDSHFLTGDLVQQLLLEAGDERAAAQHQGLHLGSAAGELNAVAVAGVIQNHLVTVFGGTVLHDGDPGSLLLQALDLAVDLLIGDQMAGKFGLQAAVNKTHGFLLFSACCLGK